MGILITGATGLIGTEIVRLCREQDIAVHYLTTRQTKIVSEENFKGFLWNPKEGTIDLACFHGITAIINLAGASISKRWTSAYKKQILDSRVDSIKTLYKGLKKTNNTAITSLVSASAIGIYKHSFSNFYEETATDLDDNFLGEVVKAWEVETTLFSDLNIKVAKIRIGLVLTSNGGALAEMSKPIKYYMGAAFGSGKQWQSWIHIKDLAKIFLFTVENSLAGVYNGVSPNPVTNSKLTKAIAKALDRPVFLPNIPKFIMQFILGEMSAILFASQRVSSKKIEAAGYIFDHHNIESALNNIYPKLPKKDTSASNLNKEFSA